MSVTERQAEKLLERMIRDEMDRRPAVPVQSLAIGPESYWIEEGTLASVESVMALNRNRILGTVGRKEYR